ncbi:hypothetical protein QR680_006196 [Steinernema hermaphroditum]|uniref:G-protein coupled receptors family 1 profile domain-containing protein n=1 Tax=Steinernema hermaphroditum TaxID=289476 RepID=A0AA39LWQ8_9BILA|nr:hypothetical protein QR680_006196 [Steinernema hermaphroditum]
MDNSSAFCGEKNEGYDEARYALIIFIGTPLAITGVLFNSLLIVMHSDRVKLKSPTIYLFVLAILDLLICLFYVPVFAVDAFMLFHGIEPLYHLWHAYVMLLYGLSRIAQFAATYMVLLATVERFIVVGNIKRLQFLISSTGRYVTVALVLLFSIALRASAFFDYEIVHFPDCPIFESYVFMPMLTKFSYYPIYNFYVITILHVFLPFTFLLVLNFVIIAMTKRKAYKRICRSAKFGDSSRIASMMRRESAIALVNRKEITTTTRTIIFLVFTYLTCNIISVFMNIMENVFPESSLLVDESGNSTLFYTITADLVSIMVVVNSMLRIFIYVICSSQFREDIYRLTSCVCRITRNMCCRGKEVEL